MKTRFVPLFLIIILLAACGKKEKTVEENGGAVITARFHDLAKNGETQDEILVKLKARVGSLSEFGEVHYSALDSTYQLTVPNFYSEKSLRLLASKGEINVNMLWPASEFLKPHGKKLIAELGKKYQVNQQEADFIIEDVTFADAPAISDYILKNNLLEGFPKGTKVYYRPPAVFGREKRLVMYFLSDSADNFNLNVATDSSDVEQVEGRNKSRYTKMFLNKEFTERYADISDRHVGDQIAISIDQYVVSTPVIESKIDTGVILSLADYDYEGHAIFEALLGTTPIKSPSEVLSVSIISDHRNND